MSDKTLFEVMERLSKVIDILRYFPKADYFEKFPFGKKLIQESKPFGGISKLMDKLDPETYFESLKVSIPSIDQRLAGVEIALAGEDNRKRLELSEPGTRKTIGALSAIPVINDILKSEGSNNKIKTLVCCPNYIIGNWIKQIENLFINPTVSVITRDNRVKSIENSKKDSTEFVLLGYSLSHRQAGADYDDPAIIASYKKRFFELFENINNIEDAYDLLEKTKDAKVDRKLDVKIERVFQEICRTELNPGTVAETLYQEVFRDIPYYTIFDEIHNVVDYESKTALSLANLFKSSRWGCLVSGTGIKNELSDIAYMTYLMGRIEDPKDFLAVFKNDPKRVRMMVEIDSNPILTSDNMDPPIPECITKEHICTLSKEEMEVYVAIENSEIFDGKENYLLLSYLVANPKKLLPEKCGGGQLRKNLETFYSHNPSILEKIKNDTIKD